MSKKSNTHKYWGIFFITTVLKVMPILQFNKVEITRNRRFNKKNHPVAKVYIFFKAMDIEVCSKFEIPGLI